MHGTYAAIDERPVVRFERTFSHQVEAVWLAVTDPDELAQWFPTAVEVDLRPGGRMAFAFPAGGQPPLTGEVLELDPPHRFVFKWGEDQLSFELEPRAGGEGCRLRFTVVLDSRDRAARDAAGWHVCLDELHKRLAGASTTPRRPQPTDEWRDHYEEYTRRGLPTGAPVPD